MGNWIAREFDWILGRYTGNYYNIAQAGVVAVFVDSHFGLDTNAGTAIAPFRTLTRAINHLNTNGANGSRIFMNGVFSENLPTQTFWYDFIGCGGGRNGKTIFARRTIDNTRIVLSINSRYHNIETLNYQRVTSADNEQLNQRLLTNNTIFIVNSLIKNCDITAGAGIWQLFFTVFYRVRWIYLGQGIFTETLNGNQNIFIDCWVGEIYRRPVLRGQNFHIHNYAPSINISDSSAHNYQWISLGMNFSGGVNNLIQNTEAQYLNIEGLDFNVRITSPLLQAGTTDELTGIRANVGGVQVGLP